MKYFLNNLIKNKPLKLSFLKFMSIKSTHFLNNINNLYSYNDFHIKLMINHRINLNPNNLNVRLAIPLIFIYTYKYIS